VYPALAVLQSLKQQLANPQFLWVGSVGGMEQALVERAGLTIELILARGLRGKNLWAVLQGLWALGQGYRQSKRLIRQFKPDALFVTGGYVCVPVTLAAWRAGVPIIIYLPDFEPGLAIKFLARFAARVAVTTPESRKFFREGLAVTTGYPVRPALQLDSPGESTKAAARRQLGLSNTLPVLLVFGGSRGARSINRAVTAQIESYLQTCQVVHISGPLDLDWVEARRVKLPPALQARYQLSDYLHEKMPLALLAADLVIARAGASVMGEFPAAGLPAILVPYPHAGRHQTLNARYLARHGAATIINDADLNRELKDVVMSLIKNKEKLQAMAQASRLLAKPQAAARLAQEILEVKTDGT